MERVHRQPLTPSNSLGHLELLTAAHQLDAVTVHRCVDHPGGIGILVRHDAVQGFDQIDLAAEAGKGLRQFAADRAGADHGHATGQLGQGENGLVGVVAGFGQARNGQLACPRARGDDRAIEFNASAIHFHAMAIDKTPVADKDVYAQLAEAFGGVVAADPGAQLPHPFHGLEKSYLGFSLELNAEFLPVARVEGGARRSNESLGRHAADIQAISPHQGSLDQRDFGPQAGRPGGAHQARRPRAQNHEVVLS